MISIVILEYQNYIDTIECITSVLASDYENFNIVIVDNHSQDSTFAKLKTLYRNQDKISIIDSKFNGGYGYGNNVGIRYAIKKFKPEFILILGNDTILNKDSLKFMQEQFNKIDTVGIVCPILLMNKTNSEIINSTGGLFHSTGFANDRDYLKKIDDNVDINQNFFYANGACMLIRTDIIKEINYFDPNIFLYWDDVDFSWRVRLHGYKIIIAKKSKVFHKLNVSTGRKKNVLKIQNREFSWIYVLFKNMEFSKFILRFPIYLSQMLIRLILNAKRKEFFIVTLKAYMKFFKELKKYSIEHNKVHSALKSKEYNSILKLESLQAVKNTLFNIDTG